MLRFRGPVRPRGSSFPACHARKRLEAEGAPVRVVQAPHDLILTHPDLVTALLTGIAHGVEPHAKAGSPSPKARNARRLSE